MTKHEKARTKVLLRNLAREIIAVRNAYTQLTELLEAVGKEPLADEPSVTALGISRRADEAAAGCASGARYAFREVSNYTRKLAKEPR